MNMTVATERSGSATSRTPVRNSWISSTACSCPIHGQWSAPSSSTNVAPGTWSAMYRPSAIGVHLSSALCRTSVGTRMVGRMSRTSICSIIRDQRDRGRRADRQPLQLGVPLLEAPVADQRRREVLEVQRAAPPLPFQLLEPVRRLRVRHPRVDRTGATLAGERAVRDHGAGPLGIGRGEQQRDGAGLRQPHHRGPLRPDGVHQRGDVADPVLQQRCPRVRGPVRHPGPPLVEHDEPGERRETAQEPGHVRLVPRVLQVRHEPR